MPGQRSRLQQIHSLTFAFSAPGKPPPPPRRNTHGIASDIRRDIVSDIRRDIIPEVRTVVSDVRRMLKGQEGADSKHLSVSATHAPSTIEYIFTVS